MSASMHVVCPQCDQVNRIAADRPAAQAVCGRCQAQLFQGRPVELDAKRFEKHVARSDLPLIVDFWAPWCGPCRAMAPVFERAAKDLEPRARFVKVNVDENPEAAARFGVRGIPALFALQHGKVAAQQAGLADERLLRSWVDSLAPR
ncbi:thiol reductase thioredoxin [Alsobacter soli]|uniref:Thioredoxin n=1 Tax=Alsobacter soli TaxID=2109933 RepID=A0A2T1HP18_9HYPH|nr:thioredoxin TrxC [Alsobacter soli]PSC03408.1 thiol reductase thioredoxin [Alsobacter soli]